MLVVGAKIHEQKLLSKWISHNVEKWTSAWCLVGHSAALGRSWDAWKPYSLTKDLLLIWVWLKRIDPPNKRNVKIQSPENQVLNWYDIFLMLTNASVLDQPIWFPKSSKFPAWCQQQKRIDWVEDVDGSQPEFPSSSLNKRGSNGSTCDINQTIPPRNAIQRYHK